MDRLIDQIYEAAVMPGLWPDVLDLLTHASGSFGTILFTVDTLGQSRSISSNAIADLWLEWIAEGWTARSVRAPRLLAMRHPGWIRDLDILTPEEIEILPEYVEFLQPRGLKWGAATDIPLPSGDRAIFSLERMAHQGPFASDTVALLNGLRPHLARAAVMTTRLVDERARTAVETLALLGLPAVALSADGTVRLGNDLFEQERAAWTTRGADRLALADPRAAALFQTALQSPERLRTGRSIVLETREGDERAVLHLIPITGSACDIFANTAALAVLTKESRASATATPLLRALFDLTPAEAELAAGLASGKTLTELAGHQGKGIETLRTHLKRVREKTGCRRQTEIALLLASLVLPRAAWYRPRRDLAHHPMSPVARPYPGRPVSPRTFHGEPL